MISVLRLPFALPVLLYQSFVLALSQIWANKVRAILTTLGILIGVAAVSAVIALIDGMKQRVLAEFEAYGTNKIFIHPQWPTKKNFNWESWQKICFKNSDFDDFLDRCPSIASYARDAGYGGVSIAYRARVAEDRVEFHGVDPQYQAIERRGVTAGRAISRLDNEHTRRVALINEALRDKLQLDRDPTGEVVNVEYFGRLLVIGLLEQPVTMMG